jgi:regulator of cell morphogenesis and NO signaling
MTITALAQTPHDHLSRLGAGELIDHILVTFHAAHRAELPELIALARKVEAVHANDPDAPCGLADALSLLEIDLEQHMRKEEAVLFPAMRESLQSGLPKATEHMRHDHDFQEQAIAVIIEITRAFALPVNACGSWRRLYAGTAKLCSDLIEHMAVENDVLFPRFETPDGRT